MLIKITKYLLITTYIMLVSSIQAQDTRWKIVPGDGIEWTVKDSEAHDDHIEMSGKRVSVVYRYGIDKDGRFNINNGLVFPLLRTIPNNTHASLMRKCNWNPIDLILVNGISLLKETVKSISLNGYLRIESEFSLGKEDINVIRTYFPSTENAAIFNQIVFTNNNDKDILIEIPYTNISIHTPKDKGLDGSYRIEMNFDKNGAFTLSKGKCLIINAVTAAYKENEKSMTFDVTNEFNKRKELVAQLTDNLILNTPDTTINQMFAFSKIRACESIYQTKNGPMHGPGGESYYAAIWANDQAEYINPYFPFVGYEYGNQSAFNAFKLFAKYMNSEWNPIPSSIIAEGTDIWDGAGDRGDAAMIAYGATRYALARGSKIEAKELWPLIEWCLEFCRLKLNKEGVVTSDHDELEGRFPAGEANLCTSSLYYDALISAANLNKSLGGQNSISNTYLNQAKILRKNIENYFGAKVQGFDTYAYYKGNDLLRSWICIPLTVNINDRAKGTLDALFSNILWTEDGLLTQAGSEIFWDRSTLYALRGAYSAGEVVKATDFLKKYSHKRLLTEHVPYAIEAWPEGDQRHLSAESALYGRIITEGMFGIHPVGFKSFQLSPRLPKEWNNMSLDHVRAFQSNFDIQVMRMKNGMIEIIVKEGDKIKIKKQIKEGDTILCTL